MVSPSDHPERAATLEGCAKWLRDRAAYRRADCSIRQKDNDERDIDVAAYELAARACENVPPGWVAGTLIAKVSDG